MKTIRNIYQCALRQQQIKIFSLLEGTWDYTKSVLVEFNTKDEFEAWYYSEDYQKILTYRLRAAKCDTILLEGLE